MPRSDRIALCSACWRFLRLLVSDRILERLRIWKTRWRMSGSAGSRRGQLALPLRQSEELLNPFVVDYNGCVRQYLLLAALLRGEVLGVSIWSIHYRRIRVG